MGIITSIRPPVPVAEQTTAVPAQARPGGQAPQTVAAPVGPPILAQAVVQVGSPPAAAAAQLLPARTNLETSAAAAAEAARTAYIRACIAAGISPLPLP